jgi:hypothetical protein
MTIRRSTATPAPAPMPALAPVERPLSEFVLAVVLVLASEVVVVVVDIVVALPEGIRIATGVELARKVVPVIVQVGVEGIVVTPAVLHS